MGNYNYQIVSWPAQPRSKKRREVNIAAGGGSAFSGGGGGMADVDLSGYIRVADLIKTTSEVSASDFLDTNALSSLMVKSLLDQKANTIHDHASQLIRPAVMVVPQEDPSDAGFSLSSGEIAEFISHEGSFAEEASSVTPADLKDLVLKINGVTKTTYNPASAASFNVDLTSYATQSWVEAKSYLQGITKAMVEAVLTGNITSHTHSQYLTSHQSLSGYATQTWVQQQGYLTSHQSLANYYTKTQADAKFLTEHQSLENYALKSEIPTSMAWTAITGRPTKLSQFTNDIISSWALAATKPSYSWSEIGSKPNTLSGYGITDATPKIEAIPYIVGPSTDSAGVWTGTYDGITALEEGLTIIYVPGKAGVSGGTTLNINGLGAKNCYTTNTSVLTTHYSAGTPILFTYHNNGWRRADYNFNSDVYIRVYRQTTGYDDDYPILLSRTKSPGTAGTNASYTAVYGLMGDTHQPTINPMTGLLKATTIQGNLDWSYIQNKPSYAFADLTSHPSTLTGYGITDGYSSLSTTGSGNAITGVSGSGHALTFTKGNTFVDLASEQTISGKKHISYLDVTGALAIPQVEPTSESGKVFEYIDNSGSFGEVASAVTPADLKDLVLKVNGVTVTTYNPAAAASFNVDLTAYATQSWVEAKNYLQGITKAMVEAVLTGNITSHTHSQYLTSHQSLSGYATQTWVQQQGYLTSHQSLSDYYTKTQADAKFLTSHQSLADYALKSEIPTSMAWTAITGRPTKLSQFTNDIISSWALAATKPSYSWSEITSRPTALSAFSGDSTHRLVTDTQITNWNSAYGWGNHADAGYLTSFTETDPTVPAWAKAASKPSYSWSEISSKPTSLSGYGISDATSKTEAIPYIVGPSTDTTAGTWTGTYEGITAYTDGLTIIYVPAVAGASTTTLNINGLGAKTCYFSNTSKLTTHYSAGTPILFTYRGGYWRRADYNTNSDTLLRVYRQTSGYNDDYPILVSRTKSIGTAGSNSSYTAVYGVVYDTTQQPTVNPYSGEFKALKVTATTLQGSLAWSYINGKPTSLSDFTNDMISSWALAASKPAYTLDEVTDGSSRKLSDYMLSSAFTKSAITTLLGNNTYAAYNANGYLPLNGGTLTGNLTTQANQTFDVTSATRSIYYTDSSNNTLRAMMFNNNGHLSIGYDGPGKGKSTYLDGLSVITRFGSTKNYTLTLSGDDGTIRSSTGANQLSMGYRSGNAIYPFKYLYGTYNVATKCSGTLGGIILNGLAKFNITNTKKARTFALKIPAGTGATTYKIIIYSSYNLCPSSTITVSTGGVNLTAGAYCALYPSYSIEGSFAGRVAFARDGNTSSDNMYILLGSYSDTSALYQAGMIVLDQLIHTSTLSVADTVMNFGYELLDLDDETMFTKITECVNADAHFRSVTVTEHVTAPKIDCTNMFLVPTSEPSSVPAGKVAEYIDLTGGSFAN